MARPTLSARGGKLVLILVACLAVVACGTSKVNDENFGKIKVGMSQKEVEDILGSGTPVQQANVKPAPRANADKWLEWKSGKHTIDIGFKDDKVVATQSHKEG